MTSEAEAFTARLNRVIEEAGGPAIVAKLVGCTPQAVYGWQGGSRPFTSRLVQICAKLGVSRRWLETGEGAPDENQVSSSLTKAHRMKEESPATKENSDLARTLAELILGFEDLPPAYEHMALAQIEEHYAEFRRRAEMRASVRRPAPAAKYPPGANHKKKP